MLPQYSEPRSYIKCGMTLITVAEGPTRLSATWFDPRYRVATPIHMGDNSGMQTFEPPASGWANEWALVLDDATTGFPSPDLADALALFGPRSFTQSSRPWAVLRAGVRATVSAEQGALNRGRSRARSN